MSDNEQLRADLARVTAALATSERDCLRLVDQRDALEESINEIHATTGCGREWSNLHDCAACAVVGVGEMASAEQLRAVTAERDAMRAIVEGRTVPPSAAEMAKHGDDGGSWLVTLPARKQVRFAPETRYVSEPAEVSRLWWCEGALWVPVRDGRPCAWPVVEVSRG